MAEKKDKKKSKDKAPDGHPTKRKEDFKSEPQKKEQRMGTRPVGPFFSNYDYTEKGPDKTSPGGGLYHGHMGKHKSVKDFVEKRRKENKKIKRNIASRARELEFISLS